MTDEPAFISRGFVGRRRPPESLAARVPPGQYAERGFPVLTAGPTPRIDPADWLLRVDGMVSAPRRWTWAEFAELPSVEVPCDIHCVTKWSKLGTSFRGVWKSAKWVAGLRVMDHDEPGFWEANGYHNRGDPWREERYWND